MPKRVLPVVRPSVKRSSLVSSVSPVWQRLTVLSVLACATIFVGGFAWQVVGALGPVLGLFFGGWLIACVLEPLVRWFTLRTRAPRSLAIVTAYVVIVVALAVAAIGATPWLAEQMDATVAGMPATVQSALARTLVEQSAANGWLASHGIALQIDVGSLATLENRRLEPLLDTSTSMALTALGDGLSAFGKLGIMLLLSVFFLVGGTDLSHRLARLAGDRVEDDVRFVFTAVHDTFDSFLRAQLVQCVLFAAGVWMCLAVAHVSAAPLVGLVAGALLLVPVVGGVLAIIVPLLAVAVLNTAAVLPIAVALIVLEQLVLNVVGPRIVSRQLGLPPLLVLFAILAGGQVAGVWGAVFGIPVLATLLTCADHFRARWSGVPSRA